MDELEGEIQALESELNKNKKEKDKDDIPENKMEDLEEAIEKLKSELDELTEQMTALKNNMNYRKNAIEEVNKLELVGKFTQDKKQEFIKKLRKSNNKGIDKIRDDATNFREKEYTLLLEKANELDPRQNKTTKPDDPLTIQLMEELRKCEKKKNVFGRNTGRCKINISKEASKGEKYNAYAQSVAGMTESVIGGLASGGALEGMSSLSQSGFGSFTTGLKPVSKFFEIVGSNLDLQQTIKTRIDEVMTYHITMCRLLFSSIPEISIDDQGFNIYINSFIFNKVYRYIKKSEEVIPVLLVIIKNVPHLRQLETSSYYFIRLTNMLLQLTNVKNQNNKVYNLLTSNIYFLVSIFYRGIMGVDDTDDTTTYRTFDITWMGNKEWGTKSIILKYMLAVVRIKLNKYELINKYNTTGSSTEEGIEGKSSISSFKEALDQTNWTQEKYEKAYKDNIDPNSNITQKKKEEKEKTLHTQAREEINDLLINLGNDLGLFEPDKYKYILNLGQTLEYVRHHQHKLKSKLTGEQHIQKVDRLTNSLTFRYNDINTYMTVLPGWWLRNTDAYDPRLKSLQRRVQGKNDIAKEWLFVSGAKDFAFGEEAAGEQPPTYQDQEYEFNERYPDASAPPPPYDTKISERNMLTRIVGDSLQKCAMYVNDNKGGYRRCGRPRATWTDGEKKYSKFCKTHLCKQDWKKFENNLKNVNDVEKEVLEKLWDDDKVAKKEKCEQNKTKQNRAEEGGRPQRTTKKPDWFKPGG